MSDAARHRRWDDRDRRDRGGGRDYDRTRDRDNWNHERGERDRGDRGDRGNRDRGDRGDRGDRDWDDRRRYRSRDRDRRDRRRSRSRSPASRDDSRSWRGGEGGRARDGRDVRRRPDAAVPPVPVGEKPARVAGPARRSASPVCELSGTPPTRRRPAADESPDDNGFGASLPTRTRTADKQQHAGAAPMSFRVRGGGNGGRDGDGGYDDSGRGRSRQRDADAMDEGGEPRRGGRDEDEEDDVVVEDDGTMDAMQEMMGFSGFSSTKGKKVAGNNAGAVRKAKKTEYRQYMNRVGGFNRPLSPSR